MKKKSHLFALLFIVLISKSDSTSSGCLVYNFDIDNPFIFDVKYVLMPNKTNYEPFRRLKYSADLFNKPRPPGVVIGTHYLTNKGSNKTCLAVSKQQIRLIKGGQLQINYYKDDLAVSKQKNTKNKDCNIILKNMNRSFSKQFSLDGKVGLWTKQIYPIKENLNISVNIIITCKQNPLQYIAVDSFRYVEHKIFSKKCDVREKIKKKKNHLNNTKHSTHFTTRNMNATTINRLKRQAGEEAEPSSDEAKAEDESSGEEPENDNKSTESDSFDDYESGDESVSSSSSTTTLRAKPTEPALRTNRSTVSRFTHRIPPKFIGRNVSSIVHHSYDPRIDIPDYEQELRDDQTTNEQQFVTKSTTHTTPLFDSILNKRDSEEDMRGYPYYVPLYSLKSSQEGENLNQQVHTLTGKFLFGRVIKGWLYFWSPFCVIVGFIEIVGMLWCGLFACCYALGKRKAQRKMPRRTICYGCVPRINDFPITNHPLDYKTRLWIQTHLNERQDKLQEKFQAGVDRSNMVIPPAPTSD